MTPRTKSELRAIIAALAVQLARAYDGDMTPEELRQNPLLRDVADLLTLAAKATR